MDDLLSELVARLPGLSDVVGQVRDLRTHTTVEEREAFFEPSSFVAVEDGKPHLMTAGAAEINGWRCHMADGSSVRMRALETGVVAELLGGRMISSMAVARAHMEVAGLAAHCVHTLYEAARTEDFAPLRTLMLQTYFGSNMRIQVKGTPELDEYLRPEEVRPLRIGGLIKAMDEFRSFGEDPGTFSQLTYGLLSEFAHPSMRATSSTFADVLAELPGGWSIRYHEEDRLDENSARMALEILRDNMRVGHGCAELLRCARLETDGDEVRLVPPTAAEGEHIYLNLLQQHDLD